ncbi:DUF7344 domain-containing protein [Natrinema gelatinilyticum]|uniref:DUF7344 domain-containing protein n=1 Tax=Natrinema gelatinilyticum TaxID=2961571 RepID=UPI0020C1CF88|nr:hypothetical protein [Natrinema gelatinilyticum]
MNESTTEFDTVLDLCRNQHRRIVLAVLADQQRALTVNDLRNTVIKHNHHKLITEASPEDITQVQLVLNQVHIPKLEATGVIKYDVDRQLVEATEQFDKLEPHLSTIIDADPDLEAPVEL